MELTNYLYNLHKKEDKNWRSWIRASGNDLHKCFYEALLKIKESQNKTFIVIANELGITYKMLQDWISGRKAIPLWVLKEIEETTKTDLKSKIERLKVYGSQDIKKPVLNANYIEIIGRHCGDGSYGVYNNTYRVNIKEDESLLRNHINYIKDVLGIDVKIKSENNVFFIDINSKIYGRIITEIFNIPLGGEKTYSVVEPSIIASLPLEKRKYFLRGLIDTDGWISYDKSNKTYVLGFKVVNKYLANSVYEILRLFKFPAKNKIKGKYFQVEVIGKANVKRYLQIVGSKNNRVLSKFLV